MFCAALGAAKGSEAEREVIASLADGRFSTWEIVPAKSGAASTRIEDFHTVGGGYDREDPIEKLRISRRASGGVGDTVVTRRDYLSQGRFVVAVSGRQETIGKICAALENPIWGIWLGRKSCVPASPLLPTLGGDIREAVGALIGKLGAEIELRGVQDGSADEGGWKQRDEPVSYLERTFSTRSVRRA